jgi:hypothetical protein
MTSKSVFASYPPCFMMLTRRFPQAEQEQEACQEAGEEV